MAGGVNGLKSQGTIVIKAELPGMDAKHMDMRVNGSRLILIASMAISHV
jgi:HSP20 family molecular chaperone IbpA